jgi:hypothetical protein
MLIASLSARPCPFREAADLGEPGSEPYWLILVDLAIHAARRGENEAAVCSRNELSRRRAISTTPRDSMPWAI